MSDKYNAADLVQILKACKKAGVSEIEVEGVKVKFGPSEITHSGPQAKLSDAEMTEAIKVGNLRENVEDAETELAQMAITDPARYEQLVIEGELQDNGRKQADH